MWELLQITILRTNSKNVGTHIKTINNKKIRKAVSHTI
ncbi:hypothetical protein G436_3547 [Leptospira interrogans serovar Hardjo str. Norma]|uniref:Uncharacterized protein n=1 Tax=Leptospira interrogans serovar Hardjo str. Norma TaxID=1279460 RepID=A0A0M4MWB4_LEPIR|nr:hypothetical protein G436_3547 [Leptospira interrogans serovar Hardjo str. Norma]